VVSFGCFQPPIYEALFDWCWIRLVGEALISLGCPCGFDCISMAKEGRPSFALDGTSALNAEHNIQLGWRFGGGVLAMIAGHKCENPLLLLGSMNCLPTSKVKHLQTCVDPIRQ